MINYLSVVNDVKKIIKNTLGSNLYLIILGGSCGKDVNIDNWSDIDIYLVIDKFDNKIKELYQLLKKFPIHVGVTIYTKLEFEYEIVDIKTKVMIYEFQQLKLNKILYQKLDDDIKWPIIKLDDIKNNDYLLFPTDLHMIRRLILSDDIYNRKFVKLVYTTMKRLLIMINIFSVGYKETFDLFADNFLIEKIDIVNMLRNNDIVTVSNYLKKVTLLIDNKLIKEMVEDNKC